MDFKGMGRERRERKGGWERRGEERKGGKREIGRRDGTTPNKKLVTYGPGNYVH